MATLKISDLSVGDWVRNEDTIYKLYAIEECGLLRGKWESDEDLAHIAKHIDYFEPIPITAEILAKNGFVKSDDYLHKIDLPDNILLGVRRQTDGYIFELKREKRRIGELLVIIRGISYIHDLQHALRLAGIDKEINL